MSSTTVTEAPKSYKLELHTAYGPVFRDVLNTEPRDATEEEVPVVDLDGLFSSAESRKEIAQAVRSAGTNMGFFYIKNHGIDEQVISKAKSQFLRYTRHISANVRSERLTYNEHRARHRDEGKSVTRQVQILQRMEGSP
jgi:isopenicillin N synthase-like dioxygenase